MQLNGSQIFVEVLCEQGVDTLFGYPGACRHFRPVPGTLLGVCRNEKRCAPGAQPNLKPEEERA